MSFIGFCLIKLRIIGNNKNKNLKGFKVFNFNWFCYYGGLLVFGFVFYKW